MVPYLERLRVKQVDWLMLGGDSPARARWAWDILDHFPVGGLVVPCSAHPENLLLQLLEYAETKGVRLFEFSPGDSLEMDACNVVFGEGEILRFAWRGAELCLYPDSATAREPGTVKPLTVGGTGSGRNSYLTSRDGALSLRFSRKGQLSIRTARSAAK